MKICPNLVKVYVEAVSAIICSCGANCPIHAMCTPCIKKDATKVTHHLEAKNFEK